MKRNKACFALTVVLCVSAASVAVAETPTQSVTVDCNNGQSLNGALSKLDKEMSR